MDPKDVKTGMPQGTPPILNELCQLKQQVEGGASWVEALENTDCEALREQGQSEVAYKVELALKLIDEISKAAGVD